MKCDVKPRKLSLDYFSVHLHLPRAKNGYEVKELHILFAFEINQKRLCYVLAFPTKFATKSCTSRNFANVPSEVSDNSNERLIPHFEYVNHFLDQVLYGPNGEHHAVLVHGNTGSSRSPCFIAAFLMEKFNMEYAGAFAIIQGRRFCVNPHDAFKAQLKVPLRCRCANNL
jgi:hypothetical protein